jgi:hypothetical protein
MPTKTHPLLRKEWATLKFKDCPTRLRVEFSGVEWPSWRRGEKISDVTSKAASRALINALTAHVES